MCRLLHRFRGASHRPVDFSPRGEDRLQEGFDFGGFLEFLDQFVFEPFGFLLQKKVHDIGFDFLEGGLMLGNLLVQLKDMKSE